MFHSNFMSRRVEITVVVGKGTLLASNEAPNVNALAVPLSVMSISSVSPVTGVPVRFNREVLNQKDGILALASSLFGGVAPGSLVHKSVISYIWAERLGSRISGFDPCKAIRKVEKFFNGSGTSMKFVLVPTGPEHSSRVLKAHLSMLSVCATGHVLDLTESLGSAEYFQANHIDLSKAGVEKAADLIAKALEEEWRSAR